MNTILRRSLPSVLQSSFRRSYHCKSADFTTVNAQGSPATEQVEVWLGEPHEAYVMVPKHVGRAIEAACAPYGNSAHIAGPDTYPLIFDHKSRHFVHNLMPFPRLTIPQDLPHQSNASTSPATLFVCGPTDIITLNGTSDFDFVRQSGDAARRLKPSLDNLKNR